MTRMSKQGKRRNQSPRRPRSGFPKTGPKKDNLKLGFKEKVNVATFQAPVTTFIPKM